MIYAKFLYGSLNTTQHVCGPYSTVGMKADILCAHADGVAVTIARRGRSRAWEIAGLEGEEFEIVLFSIHPPEEAQP